MKVQAANLSGLALNWAVEKAYTLAHMRLNNGEIPEISSNPVKDWPISENKNINIVRCNDLYFPKGNENGDHWEPYFSASLGDVKQYGPSELIAGQRCYVASEMGEEVDVPDHVINAQIMVPDAHLEANENEESCDKPGF